MVGPTGYNQRFRITFVFNVLCVAVGKFWVKLPACPIPLLPAIPAQHRSSQAFIHADLEQMANRHAGG